MLKHMQTRPTNPTRVVVLGAAGFVGSASVDLLRANSIPVEAIARADIDLLSPSAADDLAALLRANDSLVVVSANAPCKDSVMLRENISMMETVCGALTKQSVAHVVYISSDAVYGDEPIPLTEASPAAPGSMHGVMHLTRELMLGDCVSGPFAIIRPTLIYGAADPHNGYGPNRFRRLAAAGDDIVLFGDGEERRDHVLVDDVAELVLRILRHCSAGVLNIATGAVTSFYDIANDVSDMFDTATKIKSSPRVGPMPHNGYRPFDPAATSSAFPDFVYTSLADGLRQTHNEMLNNNHG
ncbi:MAG: ADP-L-glycero-D-manno-heptose-6-epimerase [Alphaproteobacteria bacterium MarineAlpha11_Bin1]|nr:MAG: ADP-L-glycero-D-manno-heptose-6-epimerase [Alphaproteobacteria bacterium MarineAlpha11_Bin1]|tara:strand:+ start:745 stop:1638 length:894 start_codon:yes stop_codon:yes gene_type:complete